MIMLQLAQLLMVVMMTWEWTVTTTIAQEKVYFFLLLILYKAKYSFTLLLVQKFLKSYAEYDDLDLDPPPASPEPTLSCETLQCMITKND